MQVTRYFHLPKLQSYTHWTHGAHKSVYLVYLKLQTRLTTIVVYPNPDPKVT
jgi:hypothetical protein